MSYSFELLELKSRLQPLVRGRIINGSFDDLFAVSYPHVIGDERRAIVAADNANLKAAGCVTRITSGHRAILIRRGP